MSGKELHFRLRQQVWNRWEAFCCDLGFRADVRDPRLTVPNGSHRPPQFFFTPTDLPAIVEVLRKRFPENCDDAVGRADRICEHRFDLLGYSDLDFGPSINWHFDPVNQKQAPLKRSFKIPYLDDEISGDSKIVWELNRHQHFVTLGVAYQLTHNEKFAREYFTEFYDWIEKNPYLLGINWASTLEVAFRTLSWLWARELFTISSISSERFHGDLLAALYRNACFIEHNLSTYFSPNTHLLGEALALFFTGVLCPQLLRASKWQRLGWSILLHEAERQILPDGGYFERSSYYHTYALDMFLHARVLSARNHIVIPKNLDGAVESMLDYLAALACAGAPPSLGDDDGGRLFNPRRNHPKHLSDPLSTGAVLYSRADWKNASKGLSEETLWLLGRSGVDGSDALPNVEPRWDSHAFPSSGTYLMQSQNMRLTVQAGPFGRGNCGHCHADALSLTVTADGNEWLTDPGTFTYTPSAKWRDAFRGTAAHNTVVIDGENQATAVDPFRWENIPQVRVEQWCVGNRFDLLVASHTGYLRLASPVLHRRTLFFLKPYFWLVIDTVQGNAEHLLEINWHTLDSPAFSRSAPFELNLPRHGSFAVVPTSDEQWSVKRVADWHSMCYGQKEPVSTLRCSAQTSLPAEFATLLVPRVSRRSGQLQRIGKISSAGGPRGFRYSAGAQNHSWILSDSGRPWQLGDFASDAHLAYWGRNMRDGWSRVVLWQGSFLSIAGATVVCLPNRTKQFEHEWQLDQHEHTEEPSCGVPTIGV